MENGGLRNFEHSLHSLLPRVLAVLVCLLIANTSLAGSREAYRSVRQGIQQYKSADYKAAAESFGSALSESPHDLRIVYNQACAAQARDELDSAVELFQKAALADDSHLSLSCRYNLGVIAARRARSTFGEKPEEADEETRVEGLKHLTLAVAHYRDCLDTDPDHREARHNLELIRLWMKNMQQQWRERDRQRARDQMDLFTFLRFIDSQQRQLRSTTRSLARLPTSPKRRHALRITATSQRELTEEIEPLKQKIETAIDKAVEESADTADQETLRKQRDEFVQPLLDLTNAVGRDMLAAARGLENDEPAVAGRAETAAIEKLDELFMGLTDYPQLLQRAIEEQQVLVDQVTLSVDNPDEQQTLDTPDVAWRQRFVEDWARMLVLKARNGLSRSAAVGATWAPTQAEDDPETDRGASAQDDTVSGSQMAVDGETPDEKLKALRESMEKAVDLGPRVVELTGSAAEELDKNSPGEALPHQEQALKLLREIAEPLRQQRQKQQEEQEKNKQDEQKQQEQPKEEKKPEEDQKKEKTEEEQRQGQQKKEKQQRRPMSEKEMQALMENVRERKRKRDEELKKLRAVIAKPPGVDKDW